MSSGEGDGKIRPWCSGLSANAFQSQDAFIGAMKEILKSDVQWGLSVCVITLGWDWNLIGASGTCNDPRLGKPCIPDISLIIETCNFIIINRGKCLVCSHRVSCSSLVFVFFWKMQHKRWSIKNVLLNFYPHADQPSKSSCLLCVYRIFFCWLEDKLWKQMRIRPKQRSFLNVFCKKCFHLDTTYQLALVSYIFYLSLESKKYPMAQSC